MPHPAHVSDSAPGARSAAPPPTSPPSGSSGPVCLVVNARSGKGGAGQARDAVQQACNAAGRGLQVFAIDERHPADAQARAAVAAAQASTGVVAVAGGDGTINTAAQATLGSGCAFGVLPQGTFNYFARNHGIPTTLEGALEVLMTAAPQPVQVGLVNERVFLVNASLGIYAQLLEDREAFKSRYGRNRLVALGAALSTLVSQHRPWNLDLQWGGERHALRTASLFVGNNALQFEQVGVAEGEALGGGELVAVAVRPMGRLARVGLLLRGAMSRLDDAEAVETMSFRALTVAPVAGALRRRVKVAADGEVSWMQMPLRFRVAPEPLWLIKPAAAAAPGEPLADARTTAPASSNAT